MLSPKPYKVYSKLQSHQSVKFTENRRRRTIILTIVWVLGFFGWIYTLSTLSYANSLSINKIIIEGADNAIKMPLEAAAMQALSGSYLNLFSKGNTFLYSNRAITESLRTISPRVESIKVTKEGLRALKVKIVEKDPTAVMCVELPDFSAGSDSDADSCYLADEKAMLYAISPVYSESIYNRYYLPFLEASSTDGYLGQYGMTANKFLVLQNFFKTVRSLGVNPVGLLIKGEGEYEMYFWNGKKESDNASSTEKTAVIYFNDLNNIETELSNLVSFWTHMNHSARAKKKELYYESIDLRYGSNVFYRSLE